MAFIKWLHIFTALLVTLHISHGVPEERSLAIHRMDIDCKVTSRFARTLITTEIKNQLNSSQEAIFAVELPKTAFITNFSMTIDGVTNVGVVKKKAEADEQYGRAVSRGESAGLVQSTGRKMEHFKISVNVGALATATFKLTYEELLKRHHGIYELQLKVKPKQLVENFQITVDIVEPQEISSINAFGTFISNELTEMVDINHAENKARIVFKPSRDQQRKCPACEETLLDGNFVVKYDVKRETSAGNIQIVNGYFVHYFAPTSLQRVPKNVIFVIDCSGSMRGRKMDQTFEAFTKILGDLPEEDHFGILKFNSDVVKWQKDLVKAVPDNIKSAKVFVEEIRATGSTDINAALLSAAEMLKDGKNAEILPEISTSIIIFLSDGDPTTGVINLDTIMSNVKAAADGVATLYSLGFGSDVDFNFLEKMSLENGGLARRIYEDSDSALQLQNFYKEVAYPVLLDVSLQYLNLPVSDLTQNSFRHYYQGSELVVAGHVENNDVDVLTAQVTAQGVSEPFSMKVETQIQGKEDATGEQRYIFGDFTERLWAYLTIEQLLTKLISAEGEVKKNVTEEALRLCLKYNFVTPLTSMVITTSEDNDNKKDVVANKPKEEDSPRDEIHDYPLRRSKSPHMGIRMFLPPDRLTSVYAFDNTDPMIAKGASKRVGSPRGSKYVRTSSKKKQVILADLDSDPASTVIPVQTAKKAACKDALVVIALPLITETICLGIDEKPNTIINLLHSSDKGITLNGRLSADESSFDKFGLLHKKKMISIEITAENITVTNGQDTDTYTWTSKMQRSRFVKKEGDKLIVSVDSGFKVIISLVKKTDNLALYVENKKRDLNDTSGLIGQFISDDQIRIKSDEITVNGKNFPAQRSSSCDLASYGAKERGSCMSVTVKTDDLMGGVSNIISNIFDVPHA